MMLLVENLSIAFGAKRVLDGISFSVAPGETVALMGPNGAGKTTVLRCALGLLRYQGRIQVDGFDAARQGVQARRRIGYVPQVPAFYNLTAQQVLHFIARLRGVSRKQADEALSRVGLQNDAHRLVGVFSGGMQQRLSLAAAQLGDPPLIVLDEPTANLDPSARAELLRLLDEFKSAGKTLVIASHRSREVRRLVDRVILLSEGKISAQGKPSEVLPPDEISMTVMTRHRSSLMQVLEPLGATSVNGSFQATLPADRIVALVEHLRAAGVPSEDIQLRSVEDR